MHWLIIYIYLRLYDLNFCNFWFATMQMFRIWDWKFSFLSMLILTIVSSAEFLVTSVSNGSQSFGLENLVSWKGIYQDLILYSYQRIIFLVSKSVERSLMIRIMFLLAE